MFTTGIQKIPPVINHHPGASSLVAQQEIYHSSCIARNASIQICLVSIFDKTGWYQQSCASVCVASILPPQLTS